MKSSSDVLAYLPDNPETYARDKDYLFSLVNTIDPKFFQRLILSRKEAAKAQEKPVESKLPKFLKIDSKMFELLQHSVMSRGQVGQLGGSRIGASLKRKRSEKLKAD